jgi:hypothetical protein
MDINKILVQLRSEREELTRAILTLEGLGGKRRSRPPKWMKALEESTQAKPKKQIARSKNEEN